MSALVSDLIAASAQRLGDPNFSRYRREDWLLSYNETQLQVATETMVLEVDAEFDILNGQNRYAYPDDAVGMKGLRFSATPTDTGSFYWLDELFEDEHRRTVGRRYPQGTLYGYLSRAQFFEVVAMPTADVASGGILTYWHTPVWLTLADVDAAATLELPGFLATFVVDGMLPRAERSLRLFQAAETNFRIWKEELSQLRFKIEDRSHDRRSALRPPGFSRPIGG